MTFVAVIKHKENPNSQDIKFTK